MRAGMRAERKFRDPKSVGLVFRYGPRPKERIARIDRHPLVHRPSQVDNAHQSGVQSFDPPDEGASLSGVQSFVSPADGAGSAGAGAPGAMRGVPSGLISPRSISIICSSAMTSGSLRCSRAT